MAKTVTFYRVVAINGNTDAASAATDINTRAQGCGWHDEESTMRDEIASCAESIRADLVLESETVEVWQAWLDGDKDNAECFFVPVGKMEKWKNEMTQAEKLLEQFQAMQASDDAANYAYQDRREPYFSYQELKDASVYREESCFVFLDGSGIYADIYEVRAMNQQEIKVFRCREILKSAVQKLALEKPELLRPLDFFQYSHHDWDVPLAELEESLTKTGIGDFININAIACNFLCELSGHHALDMHFLRDK